jgi:multiple sugar transport system ATP-binding protein
MLGLEDLLERRPAQLSGGQRQRVAMGRAVVRKPNVFLFDEPLSNLDAKLRVQMRAEIKILHQRVGTTAIYVTHDQIEAMTLADRIVVLNAGRIEQHGTPMELYRKPANLFVAGFIGSPSMNFLDGVIRRQGGPSAELRDGTKIALPAEFAAPEGSEVVIGLRPENLVPGGPGTPVSGVVQLYEPTGALTHVLFKVGGQDAVSLIDGNMSVTNGQTFTAHVAPEQVHVFDRGSGQRLE